MTLTVAHLNIYAGNRTPLRAMRAVLAHRPASVGLNEAYPFIGRLPAWAVGYRSVWDRGARDQRRGAKDVPILTRDDFTSLATLTILGSVQSAPVRIAPDRWITVSAFWHPDTGRTAHVNGHPNAAVQSRAGGPVADPHPTESGDRVDQYLRWAKTLGHVLDFLEAADFRVVFTADANWRDTGSKWTGSPYTVLGVRGYRHEAHGLDLVAWKHLPDPKVTTIAKAATGSDHVGIVAAFSGRRGA